MLSNLFCLISLIPITIYEFEKLVNKKQFLEFNIAILNTQ